MLATADELALVLQTSFTTEQEERAEALLTHASSLVAAWCTAVSFEAIEADAVELAGTWASALTLPGAPVTAVSAVTIDGTVSPSGEWSLVRSTLHRSAGWGGPQVVVAVTYDHGFADVPGDVKAVVLDRVARRWPNPEQMRAKSLDGVTLTYQPDAGGLTASEKAQLKRYRAEPKAHR